MKAIVITATVFAAAILLAPPAWPDSPSDTNAANAGAINPSAAQASLGADVQALNEAKAKLNDAQERLAAEKAKLDAVNEDVMRQVQQAVDAAMKAAKANLSDAGQTASVALSNAGQIASAALAKAANAAADAGDRNGLWTLDSQASPRLKTWMSHTLTRIGAGSDPAVIATHALKPETRADLQADLKIMDKLLLEKISHATAYDTQPAVAFTWNNRQAGEGAYIEDFGVLFSCETSVILATTESKPKAPAADAESDWERARKEVEAGAEQPHSFSPAYSGSFFRVGNKTSEFSQKRLDELVNTIIQVLPEAKHIRGLKGSDAVVITVTGEDDAGNPARLTVKTKKSDIDELAGGKLKSDDFAARVAWSVN